jgi:hypothetical protein
MKLQPSYVGQVAVEEILLRLVEGELENDNLVLKRKLRLAGATPRCRCGLRVANRDIVEILNLSPRTVNKHLEQIYPELGVENRASAAALAVRMLRVRMGCSGRNSDFPLNAVCGRPVVASTAPRVDLVQDTRQSKRPREQLRHRRRTERFATSSSDMRNC